MIRVLTTYSDLGTIRAEIIGHLDETIYSLTSLEALQLYEGMEEWVRKFKNGEIKNR